MVHQYQHDGRKPKRQCYAVQLIVTNHLSSWPFLCAKFTAPSAYLQEHSISGLLHASQTSLMPRPPPRSLQEYFYYLLVDSPAFNNWVRRIHARVNRIPYQAEHEPTESMDALMYTPTRLHKMNAFRIIWVDELKRTFKIW